MVTIPPEAESSLGHSREWLDRDASYILQAGEPLGARSAAQTPGSLMLLDRFRDCWDPGAGYWSHLSGGWCKADLTFYGFFKYGINSAEKLNAIADSYPADPTGARALIEHKYW